MYESRTTSDEDEGSREERSSDEETETDQGSESGSGSDESVSDGDDPSSGSGSGSREEEDDISAGDSSSAHSEIVSDEKESDQDDEEKKAASKREDFEKMKEISAHMDNIVQRFENLFPSHDSREGTTPPPEPPPLPQPEPVKDSRDRSVSATPMTVDRAVSAWRLTTDRAVSVASGMHFDDELSGSGCSNAKREEDNTERRRRARRRAAAHRRRSGDLGGGRKGANKRTGTQKRKSQASAAQRGSVRTESSSDRDMDRMDNADKNNLRAQAGFRKAGGVWQDSRDNRGPGLSAHGWHERLLWNELRDSLADVAGSERVMRSKWSRDGSGGDVIGHARGDKASKEERRQLIDEAIAVLLEGSSSDEGAMETN